MRSESDWISATWRNASGDFASASKNSGGDFDEVGLRSQLAELEVEMARPDLWNKPESAQDLGRRKNAVERELALYDRVEEAIEEADILLSLAREEGSTDVLSEIESKLQRSIENFPL